MFTGIIEGVGSVTATRVVAGGRRLAIDAGGIAASVQLGQSIAVSGVCLTVAAHHDRSLEFDVVQETLDCTTLGQKSVGDRVNLERSLRVGDRLDGHFVQGHVDGSAKVMRVQETSREHRVWLESDPSIRELIVPKGSISIDGVSLTIADFDGTKFSIALIPTTVERTTLSNLAPGDVVNVESDILVRTVLHHLGRSSVESLSLQDLERAAFT